MPFTADEAHAYFHTNSDFHQTPIALSKLSETDAWKFPEVASDIQALLKFLNDSLNEKLEALRQEKITGQSLDAKAKISGRSDDPTLKLSNDTRLT